LGTRKYSTNDISALLPQGMQKLEIDDVSKLDVDELKK